ncbi:sensor histidine kinase [Kribbella antibiotica]|uniref:sensor histidine kinase n=1 Tax=Kribbella antibiotica TaxID=190195 RepID=UPI00192DD67F|nr:HAMP domain-containing sensor histidine kinase [Kribbella antibiotica]
MPVRAAIGVTFVIGAALVATGVAVLAFLQADLEDNVGTDASAKATFVVTELESGTPPASITLPPGDPVQVVPGEGGLVAGRPKAGPTPTLTEVRATDVLEFRWTSQQATTPAGEPFTVYVASSLKLEHSAVRTVRLAMAGGLPPLLLLVGGLTWLVARRALRPVAAIRSEMAAITASTDLSRRVPEPDSQDEIARLARTTNETLTALEASEERQRRFVADASHELRNPLSSLRTQLEIGAAHPELLNLDGIIQDTVRLQKLASDLLLLARLDSGEQSAKAAEVDLAGLLEPDGVRIAESTSLLVRGSASQLGRVVDNLVANAQRHAATEVVLTLRRDGDDAVLEVADDGTGVPEDQRERIFERFVRLDDARSRDDGGAGLGLAIARDVVRRHGGSLTVNTGPAGGAVFTMRLALLTARVASP